ncbi:MAG: aspartate carbamoyltransferase [Burkholderiaceae bacterium]|nr:aspartate carbamoyltransferase [Burkholderiaceae bacterium]
MANPQLDVRRRLIHLLTVEGISRVALTALLDGLDRHAGRLGALDSLDAVQGMAGSTSLAAGTAASGPRLVLASVGAPPDTHRALLMAARLLDGPAPRSVQVASHDLPVHVAGLAQSDEILVLHHPASGAAHAVAAHAPAGLRIVNVRDGRHAQPLAALADVAALRRRLPELHALRVTLVGDLRLDARMRGTIHVLTTLGTPELRVVHIDGAVPDGAVQLGVHASAVDRREEALAGADVVLTYTLGTDDSPSGLVMHGAPAVQVSGPPVAEPMTAAASLACALAAVIDALVAP